MFSLSYLYIKLPDFVLPITGLDFIFSSINSLTSPSAFSTASLNEFKSLFSAILASIIPMFDDNKNLESIMISLVFTSPRFFITLDLIPDMLAILSISAASAFSGIRYSKVFMGEYSISLSSL